MGIRRRLQWTRAATLVGAIGASACHASGAETVRLKCIIGTTGYLHDCTPLDGVSQERAAALQTELQRYRQQPTIVDGKPVEVSAIISMKLPQTPDAGAQTDADGGT